MPQWLRDILSAPALRASLLEQEERTSFLAGRLDNANSVVAAMDKDIKALREQLAIAASAKRCKCGRFVART